MRQTNNCLHYLQLAGISWEDASTLRRIAMTLHRWHELECGDGNDHGSWCITRGTKASGEFVHQDDGAPFLEYHGHSENKARYTRVPDREKGAQKRLGRVLARYPGLLAYIQGDPRGCALYILRPGDIPEGGTADSYYSRGIAVYK